MDEAKKKKIFIWTVAGLVALAAVIIVVIIIRNASGVEDGPAETAQESSANVISGKISVEDIYEGQVLIPDFDMAANNYDTEKFVEKDGFITYDDGKAVLGVDVSEHQGNVDWAAVKGAGMEFAMLRLGYRGMTQGLLNVDATFEQNYTGATEAGLKVGVYFFSQAATEEEARAEADFVVDTLSGRELSYPIVYDWEPPTPSDELPAEDLRAYGLSGEEVTACAKAFCIRIKENNYTPCMYTNKHMAYNFFNLGKLKEYDLWYAEYQPAPSIYYDFRIWQYTDGGVVPGIDGGVDVNICFEPY